MITKEKMKNPLDFMEQSDCPKADGGLGVGSINSLNIGLIVKWWWRLKTEKDSLWGRTIRDIHNLNHKPHDYLANRNICGAWNNISYVRKELKKNELELDDIFKLHIKSSENPQFWFDKWTGPQILSVKYPHLYDLEDRKRCSVSDRFLNGEFVGHWKTQVVDHVINQSIANLQAEMSTVVLLPGEDQWKCVLDNSDTYSVCAMCRRIEQQRNSYSTLPTFKWNKTSPIKVNCFIWRAMQMRIRQRWL